MVATRHRADAPAWVSALLASHATAVVARVALTLPYWWSGVDKLMHPVAALAEMHGLGFSSSWWLLALLLLVQLGGSLAIIANRYAWLGAALLGGFTVFVTVIAHAFWKLDGASRFAEMNIFMEHIALIAGMAFAALHAHATKDRSTWKESV